MSDLNRRIDAVLQARLIRVIDQWCSEFSKTHDEHTVNGDGPIRHEDEQEVSSSPLWPNVSRTDLGAADTHHTVDTRDQDQEPGHLRGASH